MESNNNRALNKVREKSNEINYEELLKPITDISTKDSYHLSILRKSNNSYVKYNCCIKAVFEFFDKNAIYFNYLTGKEKSNIMNDLFDKDIEAIQETVNIVVSRADEMNYKKLQKQAKEHNNDVLLDYCEDRRFKTTSENLYNRIILKYEGDDIEKDVYFLLKDKPLFYVKSYLNKVSSIPYILTNYEYNQSNISEIEQDIKDLKLKFSIVKQDFPVMINQTKYTFNSKFRSVISDALKKENACKYLQVNNYYRIMKKSFNEYETNEVETNIVNNYISMLKNLCFDTEAEVKYVKNDRGSFGEIKKHLSGLDIKEHLEERGNTYHCKLKAISDILVLDLDNKQGTNEFDMEFEIERLSIILGCKPFLIEVSDTKRGYHVFFKLSEPVEFKTRQYIVKKLKENGDYRLESRGFKSAIDVSIHKLRLPLSSTYKLKDFNGSIYNSINKINDDFKNSDILDVKRLFYRFANEEGFNRGKKLTKEDIEKSLLETKIGTEELKYKAKKIRLDGKGAISGNLKNTFIMEGDRYEKLPYLTGAYKSLGYSVQETITKIYECHLISSKDIKKNREKFLDKEVEKLYKAIDSGKYSVASTLNVSSEAFYSNRMSLDSQNSFYLNEILKATVETIYKFETKRNLVVGEMSIVYEELIGKYYYDLENGKVYKEDYLQKFNNAISVSHEFLKAIKEHYGLTTNIKTMIAILNGSKLLEQVELHYFGRSITYSYKTNKTFDRTFSKHYTFNPLEDIYKNLDKVVKYMNSIFHRAMKGQRYQYLPYVYLCSKVFKEESLEVEEKPPEKGWWEIE